MRAQTCIITLLATLAVARPVVFNQQGNIYKREVPQEHSHESILTAVGKQLNKNNPDKILDPVFGLLGDDAAAEGQGKIADVACLQQATADQAFTNAKKTNDVAGMTAALIYRALERNTGSVGLRSELCKSIKAVNPEIAAIQQHQDPASAGAAQVNKNIALETARQIASIGGNAKDALKSGTFAPGNKNDPTGAGNTCDNANDPLGCIFSQDLLVKDATAAEVQSAVAGVKSNSSASAGANAGAGAGCVAGGAQSAGGNASNSSANANAGANAGNAGANAGGNAGSASAGNVNLGSCSDPSIEFGAGFDGRTEKSFQPANKADFNHGSADNIGIVADFICQQLQDACKASAATVNTCNQAATDASSLQGQAAADAFNSALGV